MIDVKDKVTLVTGASGGIGRAIAQKFAEHGAQVAVHYNRNKDRAQETVRSLAGQRHVILPADLTNPEEAQALTEKVVARFGRIDILVNNAGVFELHALTKLDYQGWQAAWQQTIAANLLAPAYLSFCVIEHMRKEGGGKIVNLSSRGAFRGEPEAPAYGASKAGLNAMSQSLAKALAGDRIFVFTVAPGFVDTERVAPILNGPQGEEIRTQSPLNRVAKPEEVARTVLFLASEGSEFLTGCIVDVNGASYLRT
ncbi:MAG: SDR family NAD(P)-dependent oxidoreductase [bacterium]